MGSQVVTVDASRLQNGLDEEDLIRCQGRLASAFRDRMRDGQHFRDRGRRRAEDVNFPFRL